MQNLTSLIASLWEEEGTPWSGIGSRECQTTENEEWMGNFARLASHAKWKMRSGGASGPDTYFENGTPNECKEIYLPNEKFGKRDLTHSIVPKNDLMLWLKAGLIAEKHHPAGKNMPQNVREMMTRNVFQVLGPKLRTPSKIVICDAPRWTFDDEGVLCSVSGGTGQAVRMAYEQKIPTYVWSIPEHKEQIKEAIAWMQEKCYPTVKKEIEPSNPQPYQIKLPFR